MLVQAGREGEGVLHGELGARPDGEVGGVGRIAEDHDVAMAPVLVADGGERDPPRVVGHDVVTVEDVGADLRRLLDRLLVGVTGAPLAVGEGVETRGTL